MALFNNKPIYKLLSIGHKKALRQYIGAIKKQLINMIKK